MIISPGRKYIFVHIPKTGGTSLAAALEDRAMADDILIGDTPKAVKRRARVKALQDRASGRLWKHSTLRDIDGLFDLDGFRVVTLVRNPWDRLVSYYHWLREQSFDHAAVRAAKEMAFEAFLRDPIQAGSIEAHPATSYATDKKGKMRCDWFLRLEHLADDLTEFEAHLGFKLEVGHLNRSARDRDYRSYYDDGLRDHVARIARADIERFDYEF